MSGNRFVPYVVGLGLVVPLVLAFSPEPARACGGFFCSANAPVNQAAERIIFSKNDDETVTAVVQIQYSGSSEEFAWVLPVPGIPEVGVSSDLAFRRLQQASNPQYITTTVVEGRCKTRRGSDGASAGSAPPGGGGSEGGGLDGGVNVLASGTVGPYDYVVIEPEASYEEVGDVVVEWLINQGYDVVPPGGDPDDISELLGSYLQEGMNLLAFRLTKGNSTGTIRPIWITYASTRPMIPIRPTAVAANDDMGVMVWVLGEYRAVPINYKGLELNEALIDWPRAGANYNQVVIAAANEAGGQGFVTERAGPSTDYQNAIVFPFELQDWEALAMSPDALTSSELLTESARLFGAWDGYRSLVERFLPEDVGVDEFLACPWCEQDRLGEEIAKLSFVEALGTEVVEPMIATQELLMSRPYVTRLYTTLSAPEMDLDPVFDFNPDLPDESNIHNARQVIECHRRIYFNEAPSRFELEDGRVVRVAAGAPWPFAPGEEDAPPANALVLELSTSGPGTVVSDNGNEIDEVLARHNATVASPGCGCTVTSGSTHLAVWGGLALFAFLMRRRRKR